jgi:hypothetical protein
MFGLMCDVDGVGSIIVLCVVPWGGAVSWVYSFVGMYDMEPCFLSAEPRFTNFFFVVLTPSMMESPIIFRSSGDNHASARLRLGGNRSLACCRAGQACSTVSILAKREYS